MPDPPEISGSARQPGTGAPGVRELGYVPNIAARNLARGRNHILGIFSYESVFPLESMNFYHEFLVGIEEAAEQAGYNLLMFSAAKTPAAAGRCIPTAVTRYSSPMARCWSAPTSGRTRSPHLPRNNIRL